MNHFCEEDWLLRFDRPSDEALDNLRAIITSMPTADALDPKLYTLEAKSATNVQGLDVLICALKVSLERDFEQTTREAKTAPWSFDYVVFSDAKAKGVLNVMTRLYSKTKTGNILYGRTILKIAPDQYKAWLSE